MDMQTYRIRGLDLKLDDSVQKTCETSNATSSSTRSVLYVLVLVCILAIVSVVNSYEWGGFSNWTSLRTQKNVGDIRAIFQDMTDKHGMRQEYLDSLINVFNLEQIKKRLDNNIHNEMENMHLVKVPVLGNAFDLNDLGFIGGITIYILMMIARFTLRREASNLEIALRSITERYPDEANVGDFTAYLDENEAPALKQGYNRPKLLTAVNFIRRQHHYNFLSMNEIFTLPPLEVTEGKPELTKGEKLVMSLFWFPSIVYFVVVCNDTLSISEGWGISKANTLLLCVTEAFFLIYIVRASIRCTRLKNIIHSLYADFKDNGYRYNQ
jgi:hypothetical protein